MRYRTFGGLTEDKKINGNLGTVTEKCSGRGFVRDVDYEDYISFNYEKENDFVWIHPNEFCMYLLL